tara:strand:+ start:848 stop:1174 length:327 start_codon:yes stop_codon:yes gene_type:complete
MDFITILLYVVYFFFSALFSIILMGLTMHVVAYIIHNRKRIFCCFCANSDISSSKNIDNSDTDSSDREFWEEYLETDSDDEGVLKENEMVIICKDDKVYIKRKSNVWN